MLEKKYKASRTEIVETIKTGQTISEKFLYAKISRVSRTKLGFAVIISKKNAKTSVARHLLKRRIQAALMSFLPDKDAQFCKTAVFFLREGKSSLSYKTIAFEMKKVLEKSGFFGK